jgi:drug/metabolite transporter (DMT)-like permease
MHDSKKAYFFGLAAVLLWSTVASAFKISLRYLDYAQLLFWASCASTLTLGAIVVAQGKWRQVCQSERADIGRSLVLGAFNPLLYYLILFKAYELLPAQEAQSLNYTWALTLTWLSVPLLGQRIGFRDIAAGLICYAGVLVIATRGEVWTLRFSDPLGVALALGSTVIWALYWIYNTRDSRDPIVRLLLNFACSLPLSLVYCLLATEWTMPAWPGLLGAVYIGLFEIGITYALWQLALQYAENTAKVSNLIFIAPFCSLVLIHFVLGEQILWSTMMGLLFIIAGLLYQQFGTRVHSTDP